MRRMDIGVREPYRLMAAAEAEVAVSRRGDGMPVLCLHATGHGGRDFEDLAARLVPHGFEIVAVDWPGHGNSPADQPGNPASAERYAGILAALIPALFPPGAAPIILGNSIGGAAALSLAARRPDLVRALVLANTGGLAPVDRLAAFVIGRMVAFFRAGARGARWYPAVFAAYYRLVLPGRPARVQRRRIIAAGQEMAPILAEAWASFRHPSADLRTALRGLSLPVLVTWAKGDRILAWTRSRPAVEACPASTVLFFRGGHSAFLEDPEAFAAAFIAFARGLPSQASP